MLGVFATPVFSAPTVLVRDRVDIQLEPIRRQKQAAVIAGTIVERSTGKGVFDEYLIIQIDDEVVRVRTTSVGKFSYTSSIPDGSHVLNINFEGTDTLDPASLFIASFDFSKNPILVALSHPSETKDTNDSFDVTVTTSSLGAPASVPVSLHLGPQDVPLPLVATQTCDPRGQCQFSIPRSFYQESGRYQIEARFQGDRDYDSGFARGTINVVASSNLSLHSSQTEVKFGETLKLSGTLKNGLDIAIPGAVVAIEMNAQHISDTKTDENGNFSLHLNTEEMGSGTSTLQAVFRPNESWQSSGRSSPLTITIGQRTPIPIVYTFLAFAATALALLSFVAVRTKPWEKYLNRKKPAKEESKERATTPANAAPVAGGVSFSRPKLGSALRRSAYYNISGVVQSAMTKEGIAGAQLQVGSAGFSTGDQGLFSSCDFQEGEAVVLVTAHGYIRESFSVTLPHRGEFHSTTIELLPVREKIFEMYKRAVSPLLPKSDLWGIWTPRQILEYAHLYAESPALCDLTDFVEESFFSQRTPTEATLEVAKSKIQALKSQSHSLEA